MTKNTNLQESSRKVLNVSISQDAFNKLENLAKKGYVTASINYRLAADIVDGFLPMFFYTFFLRKKLFFFK